MSQPDSDNLEFVDNTEIETDISEAVPYLNSTFPVSELINSFKRDEASISRYESAINLYYRIDGRPFTLIAFSYLATLVLAAFLQSQTNIPEETSQNIVGAVFGIPLLIASLGWFLKRIALNRARNEDISREEAIYHKLAIAIESFQEKRFDDTIDTLEDANDLLDEGEGKTAFDTKFTSELSIYLDEVTKRDSKKFLKQTFPKVANRILRYLTVINHAELKPIYSDSEEETLNTKYTPKNMVTSYLGDWAEHRLARIAAPFVLVSPIIWLIYSNVSKTGAQIAFLAFVAVMQIYFNLTKDQSNWS